MKAFRFLLFPFAILYDLVTSIRNLLFDRGVLKSTTFDVPTISVGNLSMGGTGKTPQIEYLIRLLNSNYVISVLSRGYGRKTKGYRKLQLGDTADEVGDEPLQFFKKFEGVTVAVDELRANGISNLLADENPPNIVLLDDALQHRKVTPGFTILLTKFNDLFVDDYLLPRGNLRESRRGSKRADVVIVTKCPQTISEKHKVKVLKKLKKRVDCPIFFTTIDYSSTIKSNSVYSLTTDELATNKVLLITGIENPSPLLGYLESLHCEFKHLKFSDHHSFTTKDIQKIQFEFSSLHADEKIILTTEKDFVRLSDKIDRLYYIGIETSFITGKKHFDNLITDYVKG